MEIVSIFFFILAGQMQNNVGYTLNSQLVFLCISSQVFMLMTKKKKKE